MVDIVDLDLGIAQIILQIIPCVDVEPLEGYSSLGEEGVLGLAKIGNPCSHIKVITGVVEPRSVITFYVYI